MISVFPAVAATRGTVLYLHGGGLVFGSRHDLPQPYIESFTAAGFKVIAIDYPLAPRYDLDDILDALEETIDSIRQNAHLYGDRLILFGRSAGAFLALHLQARAILRNDKLADRIIALYGYADMDNDAFHQPSRFYQAFGSVDPLPHDLAEDDFAGRFSLYVGLRQRGTWPQVVLGTGNGQIAEDVLRRMPPTYLAASAYDPDVPFRCSKRMASTIPASHFRRVYDSAEHDFDRDPTSPHGLATYREIVDWLLAP